MRYLPPRCLFLFFLLFPLLISAQQTESPPTVPNISPQSIVQSAPASTPGIPWKVLVKQKLDLMGHRNWILVVDKAFPEQSSKGMTYVYVEQGLIATLQEVLGLMAAGSHVSPVIYRDLELKYLSDKEVPGIEAFREESDRLFSGRSIHYVLHEEIFGLLDESASLFTTLVIKTNCTLPYSSVFLQLDCAYWGPDQEKALRERMEDPR